MSPGRDLGLNYGAGFPRVSGDEPAKDPSTIRFSKFSPRERG